MSSVPYLKADAPSLLEANVPAITRAYVESRLESVALVLADAAASGSGGGGGGGVEDMLDNEELLQVYTGGAFERIQWLFVLLISCLPYGVGVV